MNKNYIKTVLCCAVMVIGFQDFLKASEETPAASSSYDAAVDFMTISRYLDTVKERVQRLAQAADSIQSRAGILPDFF